MADRKAGVMKSQGEKVCGVSSSSALTGLLPTHPHGPGWRGRVWASTLGPGGQFDLSLPRALGRQASVGPVNFHKPGGPHSEAHTSGT